MSSDDTSYLDGDGEEVILFDDETDIEPSEEIVIEVPKAEIATSSTVTTIVFPEARENAKP